MSSRSQSTSQGDVVRLPLLPHRAEAVERHRLHALEKATDPAKLLQVGEVARLTGKTVRAIHHYEELGLIKPDARSKGRFRLYDPTAVTRIRWIGKLHDLGMSLAEIQGVVAAWGTAPTPASAMAAVRTMYKTKLEETRAQIAHLASLENELVASIDYLDTCESCDDTLAAEPTIPPPRSSETGPSHDHTASSCGACQLREREAEPDLVAGIVS